MESKSLLEHVPQVDHTDSANTYGNISISGYARPVVGNVINNYGPDVRADRSRQDAKLIFKSLYYESINSRSSAIFSARKNTCDWIWTTIFDRWLRARKSRIFWIAGKPGSGKSTLMKHLSQASTLKEKLSTSTQSWNVVSFFFDFRLADEVGNSIEGLLRSLLLHIAHSIIDGEELRQLAEKVSSVRSAGTNIKDIFGQALTITERLGKSFFILVDGLDEFTGKLSELLDILISLRSNSNIRLCLASRPEAMIQMALGGVPGINMSEHNEEGIQQYIASASARFQSQFDISPLYGIQERILARASGVFLWVHLALEEILQQCAGGATSSELSEVLDDLPTELSDFYQRIVSRIPKRRRAEAAIMYQLTSTAQFQVTVELLQSATKFALLQLHLHSGLADVDSIEHFTRRFHGTMGGLLEIVPIRKECYYEDEDDFADDEIRVRLIHETIRSFSAKSGWCNFFLPQGFHQVFPNNLWSRLCSKALLAGNVLTAEEMPLIVAEIHGRHRSFREFMQIMKRYAVDKNLRQLLPLLHQSIRFIGHIYRAAEYLPPNDTLSGELVCIMRCRLSSLHFALVAPHYRNGFHFPSHCLQYEVSDLMLAAVHKEFRYLRNNEHRIRDLLDRQRDDLVTAAILSTMFKGDLCNEDEYVEKKDCTGDIHDLVDMILIYNMQYTSFHLAIYLMLGYDPAPMFWQKIQNQFRWSGRHDWSRINPPDWTLENTDLGAFTMPDNILCAWFCQSDIYPQQSYDHVARLRILLKLGIDINTPCCYGGNVAGHLPHAHLHGPCYCPLTFSLNRIATIQPVVVEKLYALENENVDFSIPGPEGETLHEKLKRLHDFAKSNPESSIDHVEKLLHLFDHRERHGHLPGRCFIGMTWEDIKKLPVACPKCEDPPNLADTVTSTTPSPAASMATSNSAVSASVVQTSPSRPSPSRIPRLRNSPRPLPRQ